jgi:hypothetical protein
VSGLERRGRGRERTDLDLRTLEVGREMKMKQRREERGGVNSASTTTAALPDYRDSHRMPRLAPTSTIGNVRSLSLFSFLSSSNPSLHPSLALTTPSSAPLTRPANSPPFSTPSNLQTALAYARTWRGVDAEQQVLGRMATRIAIVLMGKHKPIYDQASASYPFFSESRSR